MIFLPLQGGSLSTRVKYNRSGGQRPELLFKELTIGHRGGDGFLMRIPCGHTSEGVCVSVHVCASDCGGEHVSVHWYVHTCVRAQAWPGKYFLKYSYQCYIGSKIGSVFLFPAICSQQFQLLKPFNA